MVSFNKAPKNIIETISADIKSKPSQKCDGYNIMKYHVTFDGSDVIVDYNMDTRNIVISSTKTNEKITINVPVSGRLVIRHKNIHNNSIMKNILNDIFKMTK